MCSDPDLVKTEIELGEFVMERSDISDANELHLDFENVPVVPREVLREGLCLANW